MAQPAHLESKEVPLFLSLFFVLSPIISLLFACFSTVTILFVHYGKPATRYFTPIVLPYNNLFQEFMQTCTEIVQDQALCNDVTYDQSQDIASAQINSLL